MASLRCLAFAALLAACALPPRSATAAGSSGPARQGPWSFELVDEWGRTLPTYEQGGRTWVLGEPGQRYLLRVRNGSDRRIEVVASVDGRDVVDGRASGWERRGYIVEPYGEATIDGYRLDAGSVAAFRFGTVARSYAAATGDARDVGVIGVAVFPERVIAWRPPPPPRPRPYPYPYPYRDDEWSSGAPRSEAPSGNAAPAPPAAGESLAQKGAGAPSARKDFDRQRPGLGTEFGEAHGSPTVEVPFVRASGQPAAVLTLRYDDRRGLLAAGVELGRPGWGRVDEAWLREQAEPFRSNGPYATPPPGWRGH
jgi:hypothetical protein